MLNQIKQKLNSFKKEKISPILMILIVLNTVALLLANIIAVKVFNVFQIPGLDWYVVLPAAVIIFPVIYIISDVVSEVYGYKWTRRLSWISFFMNLLMVAVFEITIILPGSTDLSILHSTWFLLASSLIAYMMGDFINDVIFAKMKKKDKDKKFLLRAMVSSLFGEFTDSLIYIPLGMYIFPSLILGFPFMTIPQVLITIILQPLIKVLYEVLVLPITYRVSKKLKQYELNNIQ